MICFGMGTTLITGPISDILISMSFGSVLAYSFAYLGAALLIIVGLIIGIRLFINSVKKPMISKVY